MFWNVQGAASKSFYRTFVSFFRNYNPSMVVILEPRINGLKADHFIKKSGFDRSHRVEAIGFSWGIWLLWKEIFEVEIIMNNKQFVHFKITKNNGLLSWVTAVYASPVPNVRRFLWNYLGQLVKSIKAPWLVGGDFNSILYTSERRGGSTYSTGVCSLFNNWLYSNRLYDLQYKGPHFTWSRGNLSKRLDRAVCNEDWLTKYADSSVLHLSKIGSDHRPILVRFEKAVRRVRDNLPFRFLTAWLTQRFW